MNKERIRKIFTITTNWIFLSNLGKNKFIRSFSVWLIIVPIFAKLLSRFPDEISIDFYEEKIFLVFSLPFKISIFYWCSVLFSISSWLYSATCPKIIKNYNGPVEFIEKNNSMLSLEHYANDLNSIRRKYYNDNYFINEKYTNREILNCYVDLQNDFKLKNIYARGIISIIYLFGFLMLGAIFILNTIVVVGEM